MKILYRYIKILAVLALLTISIYFLVRIYFLIIANQNGWDLFFSILLFLAETQLIIHTIGFIINIIRINKSEIIYPKYKDMVNHPSVAIVVPAKNEPTDVLEQTFITLNAIEYPNKKIYFLEGSDKEKNIRNDEALTKKYNIIFFRPKTKSGAKAGMINAFLHEYKEKYITIFDADQNPFPDFLKKTIPIIEQSDDIAFVQTPQFYSNIDISPIARAAEMQQAIF